MFERSVLPIEEFAHNVLIAGESRSDTSTLLKMILKGFSEHALEIGVLYFIFDKGSKNTRKGFDYYHKYGAPEFTVPYYCIPTDCPLGYDYLSRFLVSIFNLHPEMYFVFSIILQRRIAKNTIPKSLLSVFRDVISYQEKNPFDDRFQEYLLEQLHKSIEKIRNDPVLEAIIRYKRAYPDWFIQWKLGNRVSIDLSECDYNTRIFIFGLIVQYVNNIMPHTNRHEPQGLLIVEDGMKLFSKYSFDNSLEMVDPRREEADEILRKFVYLADVSLDRVFRRWFGDELSYRNVSVITVTNTLAEIFDSIARYAELVVLCRLGKIDRENYQYREDIKDIVCNLPDHQAVVLSSGVPFKMEIPLEL